MNNDNEQDIRKLDVEKDLDIGDYGFENIDNYEIEIYQINHSGYSFVGSNLRNNLMCR